MPHSPDSSYNPAEPQRLGSFFSEARFLTPIHRLTDSPIHRFTDSPIHRFTDSPTHRFTDSPIHRFTAPDLSAL
jgi:hypothetical protein